MLLKLGLVAVGGAVGATARFAAGSLAHRLIDPLLGALPGNIRFPVGTFAVNVFGCFAIGIIMHLLLVREFLDDRARLALVTGLLGSFTTFSAFGFETFELIERGRWGTAGTYVVLVFVVGLGAVYAGWWASGGGQHPAG